MATLNTTESAEVREASTDVATGWPATLTEMAAQLLAAELPALIEDDGAAVVNALTRKVCFSGEGAGQQQSATQKKKNYSPAAAILPPAPDSLNCAPLDNSKVLEVPCRPRTESHFFWLAQLFCLKRKTSMPTKTI